MRNKKELIYLVIIIVTFLQLNIFFKEENESTEILSYTNVNVKRAFKEVDSELKSIENIKIIELKENKTAWNGKILLQGKKKDIIEMLEKLKEYKINKYNINGNGDDFEVILEIYR